ncbi:MAG: hypothetical protein WC875_03725 [Candidatus Absconditabacterales bacterium]|jgi:hypothetical protein
MKTEKKLQIDDPRIDTALATKPFDQLFEFIKQHPQILTLERLEKFIRRCAKDSKWKGEMRDFLQDRLGDKNNNRLWDEKIVLAMIECFYFNADYDYHDMVHLTTKYDGGNALQLGYLWFRNSGYSFERDMLYKLKNCFTPEYIQRGMKEGHYREVLTLAALQTFKLPKDLTEQQKTELRKHVFEVVTANYDETNISAAETYHEDRIERIKTLFEQCPDLFTVENIVAVALTSHDLAKQIYESIPKEQRKISQEVISKLLDDELCCEKMILLIFWYHIRLSAENREKMYNWGKEIMASERLIDGGFHGCERRTAELFNNLMEEHRINVSFDDFMDALVEIGDKKDLNIEGYNEKKFMDKFFWEYKDLLSIHCNYHYRSGLESKQKKQIILDFFFWEYLPWRMLDNDEKVAINQHVQMRAEKYPQQALTLARKFPEIITLTNKSKFVIFCRLARRGDEDDQYKSRYVSFDFGPGIGNEITLSAQDFKNLAVDNMDKLYLMVQIPQIKIDEALKELSHPTKFNSWWSKSLHALILMQHNGYVPTKKEAFQILEDFSNDNVQHYFVPAWKALPEKVRPTALDLCVLKSTQSSDDPNFDILMQVLKRKLVVLDDQMIKKLMDGYQNEHNQYQVQQIAELKIPNAAELLLQIGNYKLESILKE